MQSSEAARGTRRYRGASAAERRAGRRERLMDAGLELFGTEGYASTSIRSLSAAAGLNTRYFYESFSDREDLLYHVYGQIMRDVAAAVVRETAQAESIEEQARTGLRVAWSMLTEDRRRGRIVALEVVGVSERLERVRRRNRHAFADILVSNAMSLAGEDVRLQLDPMLASRALIGAVMELLVDWIRGDIDTEVDEIVDFFTRMFTAVARATVAEPGRSGVGRQSRR